MEYGDVIVRDRVPLKQIKRFISDEL